MPQTRNRQLGMDFCAGPALARTVRIVRRNPRDVDLVGRKRKFGQGGLPQQDRVSVLSVSRVFCCAVVLLDGVDMFRRSCGVFELAG